MEIAHVAEPSQPANLEAFYILTSMTYTGGLDFDQDLQWPCVKSSSLTSRYSNGAPGYEFTRTSVGPKGLQERRQNLTIQNDSAAASGPMPGLTKPLCVVQVITGQIHKTEEMPEC